MTVHPSKLSFSAREALGFTDAQCLYDPELHVGPRDLKESPDQKAARLLVAGDICVTCPVMGECFTRAIDGAPESGVWATFEAETLGSLFSIDLTANLGGAA